MHARLPCPSPSPGARSNSCPLSQWWLSCPLSSPSPSASNLAQHQGLFQWVSSLHQVAKVLELQLKHQSFQWIFRVDFLFDGLLWSPCSPRDSQESLNHINIQNYPPPKKKVFSFCSSFFINHILSGWQLEIHRQKNEFELLPYTIHQTNSKLIIDINVRAKIEDS